MLGFNLTYPTASKTATKIFASVTASAIPPNRLLFRFAVVLKPAIMPNAETTKKLRMVTR